jgi:hypothetical protein
VRLLCSRPRHATPVPDTVITFIAGTITELSPSSPSLLPPSTPTSGPDPVSSLTIPLGSTPSNSLHSAETISAETISIPITIASPPATVPIPLPCAAANIVLPPATPALDDVADPAPDEPVGKKSAAKLTKKLEHWWSDHRQGVVSGAKTLLEVASKALDDIPVGGSVAAKMLELGASALERVQVMFARQ